MDKPWHHLREYPDYQAYLAHQGEKIGKEAEAISKLRGQQVQEYRERFPRYPFASPVLCLGARLGIECDILQELGHAAYGLDIAPREHPQVGFGDFHDLRAFPPGVWGSIYCNSIDHALEPEKVIREADRICEGPIILEMASDNPGEYEVVTWTSPALLGQYLAEVVGRVCEVTEPVGIWQGAILCKPQF